MKIRIGQIGAWYFFLILSLLFVIGGLASFYVYNSVSQGQETGLLRRTNTIAQFINPDYVESLTGTDADLTNPNYLYFKKVFRGAVTANPDSRFVYFLGLNKDNQVFFFVDSETPKSSDYSPPGQVYVEAPEKFHEVFATRKPMLTGIYTDRWGTWLTALTPILEPKTGKVLAVLAMDISASSYQNESVVYASVPALTTLLILLLLVIYYFFERKEQSEIQQKAELISIASHEIRGPLNGIAWGADRLLKGVSGKLDANQVHILDLIKDGTETLLETVNELLDLYVLQNQKKAAVYEKLNVKLMFDELVSIMELLAQKKGAKILLEIKDQGDLEIKGDKDKLKRMFSNLVSNAIKYSKDNGQIKITIQNFPTTILFTISDGGIGIPEADQKKIFSGFFRSLNARSLETQGSGIGLFYVREVVANHKGKIWFESKEGVGTTFFVDLPKNN